MKKFVRNIIITICILAVALTMYHFSFKQVQPTPVTPSSSTKKKVLIFTSRGGGGHTATTKALHGYLESEYDLVDINIFSEVLGWHDTLSWFTRGNFTGEDLYNTFMNKQYVRATHMLYAIGQNQFNRNHTKNVKRLKDCFEKHKPDLVISVIPMVNGKILQATQEMNLPFIMLPTDLDLTTFVQDIQKPDYKKFHLGLFFEDKLIREKLIPAKIPSEQVSVTGLPIRPDFFEPKNIPALKKQYEIPQDKPVILLMLGAAGADGLYTYGEKLATLEKPAHLIFCVGRNAAVGEKIKTIKFPSHISYSVIGFTQRVSDLMAIGDMFISKSGSVSVCEAIYMNIPLLLDATGPLLRWEKFNHTFIKHNNFGDSIEKYKDVVPMITDLLDHPEKLQTMKDNLKKFPKKNGGEEVKKLVAQMITSPQLLASADV